MLLLVAPGGLTDGSIVVLGVLVALMAAIVSVGPANHLSSRYTRFGWQGSGSAGFDRVGFLWSLILSLVLWSTAGFIFSWAWLN
jgi:hypothetical protein